MRLPPRIVALSPGTLTERSAERFPGRVAAALEGGLLGVLLREPELADRPLLELARALARLRARHPGAWLGVHDRGHLALLAGADGLHLGWRSLPPERIPEAWRVLAVGLSAHAGDAPERWRGADYIFYGPVRATPSKAGLLEPTGMDGLANACARAAVPLLALGGISAADIPEALASGAYGVATLGGILGAADPREAARGFTRALAGVRPDAGLELG